MGLWQRLGFGSAGRPVVAADLQSPRPAAAPLEGRQGHIGASSGQSPGTPILVSGGPQSPNLGQRVDIPWSVGARPGLLGNKRGSMQQIRQPHSFPPAPQVGFTFAQWGGFSRLPGIFGPKLGYQASLTSYGFPSTWDTLRLVPANPNAAQALSRRTRPVVPAFGQRGGGQIQIPGVFVPVKGTGPR